MKNIDGKKVIWQTENFVVVAADRPFISREEGGHLMIRGNGDKYRYDKTGFYDGFKQLDDYDIECIIEEMKVLENSSKYSDNIWRKN